MWPIQCGAEYNVTNSMSIYTKAINSLFPYYANEKIHFYYYYTIGQIWPLRPFQIWTFDCWLYQIMDWETVSGQSRTSTAVVKNLLLSCSFAFQELCGDWKSVFACESLVELKSYCLQLNSDVFKRCLSTTSSFLLTAACSEWLLMNVCKTLFNLQFTF